MAKGTLNITSDGIGSADITDASISTADIADSTIVTLTCGTTNTSTTVTAASTTGMIVGAAVSGAGIPALATVVSIITNTSFVLSAAATATASVTLTFDSGVTSKKLAQNLTLTGDYVGIPAATTTQRDALTAATGMMVYNSTLGMLQQYNASGWTSIASPPVVSSISPTTADETGDSIVITGSNFDSAVTVKIIGNDATQYDPASTTRNSSTQVTITRAANITVANEPYDIKVINASGLSATLENALDAGGSPSWTTFLAGLTGTGQATSGRIATITDLATGTHDTLAAVDPDGNTVTYSVIGTDTWAARNIATNTSTGVVSGDPTNESGAGTTYTNTIRATDTGGNTTDQSLNIIVNPFPDGSTSAKANASCQKIQNGTSTTTSGLFWILADTSYNSGNAAQHYCDMSTHANYGWTLVATRDPTTNLSSTPSGDNTASYGTTLTSHAASADNFYKGDWAGFGAWTVAWQQLGNNYAHSAYMDTVDTDAERTFLGTDLVYKQTDVGNAADCRFFLSATGAPLSGGTVNSGCGGDSYDGWTNDPTYGWCWWHHPSSHAGTGSCGAGGDSHGHPGRVWIGGGV
jgi:hypothetical protein